MQSHEVDWSNKYVWHLRSRYWWRWAGMRKAGIMTDYWGKDKLMWTKTTYPANECHSGSFALVCLLFQKTWNGGKMFECVMRSCLRKSWHFSNWHSSFTLSFLKQLLQILSKMKNKSDPLNKILPCSVIWGIYKRHQHTGKTLNTFYKKAAEMSLKMAQIKGSFNLFCNISVLKKCHLSRM